MTESIHAFHEASNIFDLDEATPVQWPCMRPAVLVSEERKALRDRFASAGNKAVQDHEMLELVLFRAIPRADIKLLTKELMKTFGDFNRVITASPERLLRIAGVTDIVVTELKIIEAAAQRMARAKIMNRSVLSSWDALLDYCHTAMAHRETEQFRVLYLDRKNTLIADEAQAKGTVDHVPVYPREIAKRALELNASALILVHNHPSGDPTPSDSDLIMTEKIQTACTALSITLHDHLIIGKSAEISFKSEGYL